MRKAHSQKIADCGYEPFATLSASGSFAIQRGLPAIWAQLSVQSGCNRQGLYQSLVSKLQSQNPSKESGKLKKGEFAALCEFLTEFDKWSEQGLDRSIETSDLVMTFSNVNQQVVEINADAIGLAKCPAFQRLKLGRLHDLVGRRNEIGHGAIIEPPPNEQFKDLWDFTETLIIEYCNTFTYWMRSLSTETTTG